MRKYLYGIIPLMLVFTVLFIANKDNSVKTIGNETSAEITTVETTQIPTTESQEITTPEETTPEETTTEYQGIKILFIGNSHTMGNRMPEMVKAMAEAKEIDCRIETIAENGHTLKKMTDPSDMFGALVNEALTTKKWDYIVLQENRDTLVSRPTYTENAIKKIAAMVKDTDAKLIIYAIQGNKVGASFGINGNSVFLNFSQIEEFLTRYNYKFANRLDGLIAPVGMDFVRVIESNSNINLYQSDGYHGNINGSYLAACDIFENIFNESAFGNPYIPGYESEYSSIISKMTVNNALYLQKIADSKLKAEQYSITVKKGENGQIKESVSISEGNDLLNGYQNKIVYTSIEPDCLSVDKYSGEFTALYTGEHLVKAQTDSGLVNYVTVNVMQPANLFKINNTGIVKIYKNKKFQFEYTIGPTDTSDAITWTSSNEAAVTVSETGKVKAVGIGISKIKATTDSGLFDSRYVRVRLDTPTEVKVVKRTKKSIKLTWKNNEDAERYLVYRKGPSGSSYKLVGTVYKEKFIDKNLKKGKKYKYRVVSAYSNAKLNSLKSNIVEIIL